MGGNGRQHVRGRLRYGISGGVLRSIRTQVLAIVHGSRQRLRSILYVPAFVDMLVSGEKSARTTIIDEISR